MIIRNKQLVQQTNQPTNKQANQQILQKEFNNPVFGQGKLQQPQSLSITPEEILEIVNGTCAKDKITAFGITHYKYDDCKSSDMVTFLNASGDKMSVHKDCKKAFDEMQADAKKEGINIDIISSFRSKKRQVHVFAKKFKDKTSPTPEEMKSRLRFSAPSGYSEHHTGYAIDINSLDQSFGDTEAGKWLAEHAIEYGFEMSFPKNNHQNLGYEPWHFRYIGTEEAKKIFSQARE